MVGVLALQGAFLEHRQMMELLNVPTFEIRQLSDLKQEMSGLILPGGESTVQGKLLRELDLFLPIKEKIQAGLPVFGTCAGMILLAKKLDGSDVSHLGTMDMTVMRNAYGRQLGSFEAQATFADRGEIPMTFIRAPYIKEPSKELEILATVQERVVAARQKNQLAIAFHPEVTKCTAVHEYFVDMMN